MLDTEFMGFVRQLSKIEVDSAPGYKVAKAIATHPKVSFPNPVETAFSIQVEVNEDFVNDPDFAEVVDAYVTTLNRIYDQLLNDFPVEAVVVFRQMAKTMTLKYSY